MKINYSDKELEALKHIRNALMHTGQSPSIRKLMRALKYKSPRSVSLIVEQLIKKGSLEKKADGTLRLLEAPTDERIHAQTVSIPLVGSVACGIPMLAEENLEGMVSVSLRIAKPPHKYFLLRAKGDSMDGKGIIDGDLVLIKRQETAKEGEMVVALVDEEATIKEFHRSDGVVVLKPKSTNPKHKPIVLHENFRIQGIVVTTIKGI